MPTEQDKEKTQMGDLESSTDKSDRDPPTIRVYSDVFDRVVSIPYSSMALWTGIGRLEGGPGSVLVPCVELRFVSESEDNSETKPLFCEMLTLENTAYLLADMAGDIRRLFHDLSLIAEGGLKLEGVRMKHSHRFMVQARQELDGCIEELNRIIENLGPPS